MDICLNPLRNNSQLKQVWIVPEVPKGLNPLRNNSQLKQEYEVKYAVK